MTFVEVEPQPRVDVLVRLPSGEEARRTDYVGVAWLDGKPAVSGLGLQRSPRTPRGIRSTTFAVSFFVPDSLRYARAALGSATLSVSADLRAAGESGAVVDAAAVFADDPAGAPTWIQVHLSGAVSWPAAIGYRIVALTRPDAVL